MIVHGEVVLAVGVHANNFISNSASITTVDVGKLVVLQSSQKPTREKLRLIFSSDSLSCKLSFSLKTQKQKG